MFICARLAKRDFAGKKNREKNSYIGVTFLTAIVTTVAGLAY
jgi:hypothetical protein